MNLSAKLLKKNDICKFFRTFLQFYSELFDIFTPNFLEVLLRTFREMPVLRKKSEVFTNFLRKLILFSIFVAFCFHFLRCFVWCFCGISIGVFAIKQKNMNVFDFRSYMVVDSQSNKLWHRICVYQK